MSFKREVAVIVGSALAFIALLVVVANALDRAECNQQWPDRERRFGFISGCMVKTSHGWQPAKTIREVSP